MMRSKLIFHALLAALLAGCLSCGGTSNVADCEEGKKQVPCSARTKEEDARRALDDKEYDTAITLLTELISDEPDNYTRHTLLAAAYAARAGFDILNVAKAQFSGGGTLFDKLASFLPSPKDLGVAGYKLSLGDMKSGVDVLNLIPAATMQATDSDKYAASAALQLTLYQSAYSIMYLNQFTISADTGQVDLNQLQNMSEIGRAHV